MHDIILHHYDEAPFAEKVRLVFGIKGLAWRSVIQPSALPKPDLVPLTGGYRRTPVLQIGADIYCDTRLIARELERRFPTPTLFPAGNRGVALALSQWSDTAFFEPGAGLSMGMNKDVPEDVVNDRKAFFNFMDFSRLEADVPHMLAQLRCNADLVEQQLADGREYLFGSEPGWADITAYFPLWMTRVFIPGGNELLAPCLNIARWEHRIKAIGHGQRSEIDSQAALEQARAAEPLPGRGVDAADPLRLNAGDRVSVSPDDYGRVPVTGELITLELHEVAVRRQEPRVGTVVTHFPRIGYRVEKV